MNSNGGMERLPNLLKAFENIAAAPKCDRGAVDRLTCKRISQDSLIYALCKDDHPSGGAHCLKSIAAFMFDCLSNSHPDESLEISPEGVNGMMVLLCVMRWGIEEIENCFQ